MKEKTHLFHKFVCFRMNEKGFMPEFLLRLNILVRNDLFLKSYFTPEGAVSHTVFNYQQLSIARYQVRFYAL